MEDAGKEDEAEEVMIMVVCWAGRKALVEREGPMAEVKDGVNNLTSSQERCRCSCGAGG